MKKLFLTSLLVATSALLGIVFAEFGFRIYRSRVLGLVVSVPQSFPDARLGIRPNPGYPGYDKRGWRNATALGSADIVVLGDSQTYGTNIALDKAWPNVLANSAEHTVYQMSFGGYGPLHFAALLDEAFTLNPKILIATYYLGNDLVDAFSLGYSSDAFRSFRTKDPALGQTIARAEAIDPGFLRSWFLDCQSVRNVPDPSLQEVENVLRLNALGPLVPRTKFSWRVDDNLRHYSRLYDYLRARAFPDYGPPLCISYRDKDVRTVLTPGYRLLGVTSTDPRILEGERMSLLAFEQIAAECRRRNVAFYVVFIPTKELVFRKRVDSKVGDAPYLRRQWAEETRIRTAAVESLEHGSIKVIDTLPDLEKLLESGVNPYKTAHGYPFDDGDGHPVEAGHSVMAAHVFERLQADGALFPRVANRRK